MEILLVPARGLAQLAEPLVVRGDVVDRERMRLELVRTHVVLDRTRVILVLIGLLAGGELGARIFTIVGGCDAADCDTCDNDQ